MKTVIVFCVTLAFSLLFPLSVKSSERPDTLKVGVALSGGGAKGIAHIGFLQAIYEAGIRPDFITGVSMGSIVGGMYASGYHPDVMAQEFRKFDYNLLLSDDISEDRVVFDEKPFFRSRLLPFTIEDWKFKSPGGLIEGQYITSLMEYYTWPVALERDFSKFPVPFKAVATNVETVSPRLFDRGNLVDVMRASMAVPLAFTPVEVDDSLYVDGGVVRNFAAEELKDMGADIVIGSFTSFDLPKKDQLMTAPGITGQLMSYTGKKSSVLQFDSLDLLIEYDFGNLTGTDFKAYDTLINLGYQTTLKQMDTLRALARLQGERPDRRRVPVIRGLTLDSITVEGNQLYSTEEIIRYLGLKPGYHITPDLLRNKMTYMYGLFLFDKVNYELSREGQQLVLHLRVKEKPRNWMNLSLHYDDHYDFGVNFDYIQRNLFLPNSRFTIDAYVSRYFRFKTGYDLYFGNERKWSTTLGVKWYRDYLPSMRINGEFLPFTVVDGSGYFSLGRLLGSHSKLALVLELEGNTRRPVVIQSDLWNISSFTNANLRLQYRVNDLDHYYFPKKGREIGVEISNVNLLNAWENHPDPANDFTFDKDSRRYFRDYGLLFRSRWYSSLSESLILGWKMNAFFSLGNELYPNNFALIGGYDPLSRNSLPFNGFNTHEFVSENALGTGFNLDYRIREDWVLSAVFDAYYIEDRKTRVYGPFFGTGLQLGYDFLVGPVRLGIMHGFYSSREVFDRTKLYFSIGYLLD
jgi:NTE family protein